MPFRAFERLCGFMRDVLGVYVTLLKVLVPALVVVKILDELGATVWLGHILAPLMQLFDLPPELGIVWATTLLTNIFTGMVVFFEIAGDMPLTVAQISVFSALLLIGHSLPVEGAVARRAGVPWWATLILRVGGALVFAGLLSAVYPLLGTGNRQAELMWRPEPAASGLGNWLLSQLETLGMIFLIILALMILLAVLRWLKFERLIHMALSPLLKTLGIGRAAANVTVIGTTLGLTYGAGLLIRDVDSGVMSQRDSVLVLCFLGLCHSVIEDTLLILLLGADLWAVLWARVAFAILVIACLARWPSHWLPVRKENPVVDSR